MLLIAALLLAQPVAELSGDATEVQFAVHGAQQRNLRVPKGGAFTLRFSGAAQVAVELREEALAPRQEAFVLEMDGSPVAPQDLNTALDPSVHSEKGLAVSRARAIQFGAKDGAHTLNMRWPADAAGDALVAISGLAVTLPLPMLALPLPVAPPIEKKAEPALAPLTAEKPKVIIAEKPMPAAKPAFWHDLSLDVRAGGDRSAESYTAPVALGRVGAEVAYRAMPLLPISLGVDLGFSRQTYQARTIAGDGHSLAATDLDEQRIDTVLGASYDLGPWLRKDGRLAALPFLGAQYTAVRNGAFPLDLFGVAAGARARWSLSSALAVQGSFRWAYNFLKGSTLSAVGTPQSDLLITAGISMPVAGGYAFDVGYRGDVLSLTYDTRVSHGMGIGVHTGF